MERPVFLFFEKMIVQIDAICLCAVVTMALQQQRQHISGRRTEYGYFILDLPCSRLLGSGTDGLREQDPDRDNKRDLFQEICDCPHVWMDRHSLGVDQDVYRAMKNCAWREKKNGSIFSGIFCNGILCSRFYDLCRQSGD